MKRIYLIILVCWTMLSVASAQELTVKEMKATNDISASQYRVNDLNGQPCALVKVQLATRGAKFAGSVIGTPEFKNGVYWVYMPAGVKELEVQHNSFVPCHVTFSDYGIQSLQSLTTYVLTLLMPQGGAAPVQVQKLVIKYSPANATVIIDTKLYKGNGRVEAELPVGNHNYLIAADGYESVEATVKLTANTPRTVTEELNKTVVQEAIASTETRKEKVQEKKEQKTEGGKDPFEEFFSDPFGGFFGTSKKSSKNQTTTETTDGNLPAVETFTVNGVSFNMVRVDGGTFTMGATSEQGSDANGDEKPAHQVTLSTYSIGETEVTQALWQAVMGSNPSRNKSENLPVEEVSWKDCQKFIYNLRKMTGKRFRLPTEAEWEYAARGGNKSRGYKYSGSNDLGSVAWYTNNSGSKTHDVKTKQANELGLYDMSGNVYEWCQDKWGDYKSGSQTNPNGPSSGSTRVVRGGCWGAGPQFCRSPYRASYNPSHGFDNLGLRLAL